MNTKKASFITSYTKSTKLTEDRLKVFIGSEAFGEISKLAEYALFRGHPKRLRPFLMFLASGAVGSASKRDLVTVMAGIELLHTASLVHDDIIDKSDIRRGVKTVVKKYGIPNAVITGDFLLAQASMLLSRVSSGTTTQRALKNLIVRLSNGQIKDSVFENSSPTFGDYIDCSYEKTGCLFEYACFLGGAVSGGSRRDMQNLSLYGKYLGVAFQIQNDLNHIFSNKTSNYDDILNAKKTYITIKALEKSKPETLAFLKQFDGREKVSSQTIEEYKKFLIRIDVVGSAKKDIEKYSTLALSAIKHLKESDSKKHLNSLPSILFSL